MSISYLSVFVSRSALLLLEIMHYLQHMTMIFVSINPSDSWDAPDLGHVLSSGINKKIKKK